ncbi:unnamed protein product [Schistosoma rodhaini]|nr:unnamed protein product [Schistosoma rodhaini]
MFGRSFFFFSILILCWSCIFINLLSLSCSVAFEVRSLVHNDKVIDGGAHNVFWFVHITDLHFSEFGSKDRQMDFLEFCSTYIPVIRPEIVIASGDITDGKGKTFSSSSQNPEEWRDYSSLLKQSGVLNLTRWFDVRGNHDSFGVPSFGGDGDYYSQFGVSGRSSFRSNIFKLVKPYGQYSFISIDLSTEPGLKWPLNFFGSFNLNVKTQFSKSIDKAKDSNQTFVFGHYPTSTVVSSDSNLGSMIGDSAFAYLCGHLHTLFGLAKKMYFLQPQGYWEWELGDWRENRYFRIVAVDNDLVSFVDVRKFSLNDSNKEWPIILITNPKNANFLLPRKEPFHRIEFSTHIRILVWSLSPILRVSVSINGIHQGFAEPAKSLESGNSTPLYVLPWNTSQWSANPYSFHVIEVTAKDANNNQGTVVQSFSLRNRAVYPIGLVSKFLVANSLSVLISALYYTLWITIFTFVVSPVLIRRPNLLVHLFRTRIGRGMYLISSIKKLLLPILVFMVYQISCPLFMGYLVADKFGIVFSFGIYIDGIYIPERLTYLLAEVQLLGFGLYLLFLTYHCGHRQYDSIYPLNNGEASEKYSNSVYKDDIHSNTLQIRLPKLCSSPSLLIITVIYVSIQLAFNFIFVCLSYGFVVGLLSPGLVIPTCVACILYIYCPRPNHVKYCIQ